ncbi:MAG TPA: ASCH domain-containing protein [Kofleriaceae bacterium]|nr:ASCH domain-containing protein [Kofleriaceae bacterium]
MRAHAVVLDVTHRSLIVDGAPFAVDVPAGERPLRALERAAPGALGRELGFPLAQRVDRDDAWFAFVDDELTTGDLVPLATWAAQGGGPWAVYVEGMLGGWQPPTTQLEAWCFGNEPRIASQLAHCVIKGPKRATASWVALARHEGWTDLAPGAVSIITDGFGVPLCAIETTQVDRVRFGDVTPAFAAAEAEGDASLADWRSGHQRYYGREAARIGLPFTDDSEVDLSHFRVLHVFGRTA